jgi:hypothetical protein
MMKTRDAINQLPKAPSSDPSNEIATLLHNFVRDLARHVDGVPDENGLLQMIRPHQEQFRRKVRWIRPNFVPFKRRYARTKTISKPVFLSSEEGVDAVENILDPETPPESEKEITMGRESLNGLICVDEMFQRAYKWIPITCLPALVDHPQTVHGCRNYLATTPLLFSKLTSRLSPKDGMAPPISSVVLFTTPCIIKCRNSQMNTWVPLGKGG